MSPRNPGVDLESPGHFHFVGLGGIGMSALAEILLSLGHQVSGSDLMESPQLERLRGRGARVFIGHDAAQLAGARTVVYSSAVPADNPELARARAGGLPLLHRADLLAAILSLFKGITVSGTHGKTTTSAMIGLLMVEAGLDPTLIIGAGLPALGSNARLGRSVWAVAEADESDRSFLRLPSFCSVVTNIERDHMDAYGSFSDLETAFLDYMNGTAEQGTVVACRDCPNVLSLLKNVHRPLLTYGLGSEADFCARSLDLGWRRSAYRCYRRGQLLGSVQLRVPGRHNVVNSLAAVAVAQEVLQLPFEVAGEALSAFSGAERRLQWKGEKNGVWVIDDYGHHPTEIRAALAACSASGRRTLVVFQPHRYSRTRDLMEDLAACFEDAGSLLLLDVYAAGEEEIAEATSLELAGRIRAHRPVSYFPEREQALDAIRAQARKGDLLLTLGAGDVWKIGEAFLEEG